MIIVHKISKMRLVQENASASYIFRCLKLIPVLETVLVLIFVLVLVVLVAAVLVILIILIVLIVLVVLVVLVTVFLIRHGKSAFRYFIAGIALQVYYNSEQTIYT